MPRIVSGIVGLSARCRHAKTREEEIEDVWLLVGRCCAGHMSGDNKLPEQKRREEELPIPRTAEDAIQ